MTRIWGCVATAEFAGVETRARVARQALAEHAAGIGVALAGPWAELSVAHHEALPPIADVSAPQAVPDSIRRSLSGRFLGVDDLYEKSGTIPSGYIRDAELLVARGTAEFSNWLAGIPA